MGCLFTKMIPHRTIQNKRYVYQQHRKKDNSGNMASVRFNLTISRKIDAKIFSERINDGQRYNYNSAIRLKDAQTVLNSLTHNSRSD